MDISFSFSMTVNASSVIFLSIAARPTPTRRRTIPSFSLFTSRREPHFQEDMPVYWYDLLPPLCEHGVSIDTFPRWTGNNLGHVFERDVPTRQDHHVGQRRRSM
ncbi:hypothetical protein ONS95_005552 [Cadophora gregata]|uniref:uncharacterized protein n=1 Tax=Cadophora gregata TaxID=51156 RepID=UPI0026DC9EAF|nr:uncharacterized protein ONS95_005552 [Cadophora gregata]KAK0103533.1 hypothetical protein ONS95_005552 [Cadophora gregata]